jgi:hypothetical protein
MLATMIVCSGLRSVANAFLDLCLPVPHLVLIHSQLPLCHIRMQTSRGRGSWRARSNQRGTITSTSSSRGSWNSGSSNTAHSSLNMNTSMTNATSQRMLNRGNPPPSSNSMQYMASISRSSGLQADGDTCVSWSCMLEYTLLKLISGPG